MMQRQPRRPTSLGAVVLAVLCSLAMLAVAQPPARAASPATSFFLIGIDSAGGDHFEPCAAPSSGNSLVLVPGDTLQFLDDLARDVQVTFTDVTHNTTQTFNLTKNHNLVSVTPRANSSFTYAAQGLTTPTCVGKVLGQTPAVQTILITRAGGFAHVDPCSTDQANPSLVLQAGEILRFQNNLSDVTVTFVEIPQNSVQTLFVPGRGGTAILTPLAGASFSYITSSFSQGTCFGRVLAASPGTLPPTGGGPIAAIGVQYPWLPWGSLLVLLGVLGLSVTLFARRRKSLEGVRNRAG